MALAGLAVPLARAGAGVRGGSLGTGQRFAAPILVDGVSVDLADGAGAAAGGLFGVHLAWWVVAGVGLVIEPALVVHAQEAVVVVGAGLVRALGGDRGGGAGTTGAGVGRGLGGVLQAAVRASGTEGGVVGQVIARGGGALALDDRASWGGAVDGVVLVARLGVAAMGPNAGSGQDGLDLAELAVAAGGAAADRKALGGVLGPFAVSGIVAGSLVVLDILAATGRAS